MDANKICSWRDLSYTDASELLNPLISNQSLSSRTKDILDLNVDMEDRREQKRSLIVKDLFYHVIVFARRENFSPEQLSALYSIVKSIHRLCISTPYDNTSQCYQMLKELVVSHSVHRPPYSIQLYSLEQVKNIMEYVLQTYFKHFKLYKYAFTKRVLMDLKINYEGIEDTPQPSQTQLVQQSQQSEAKVIEVDDTTINMEDNDNTELAEILTEDQQQLQGVITQTLSNHMKKLKLTVEKEIADSNTRLSEKLEALEAEFVNQKEKNGIQ